MNIKICPMCGGKVSKSRNICIHCGYEFVQLKTCPDCESEIPLDAEECPVCGYVFSADEIAASKNERLHVEAEPDFPLEEETPAPAPVVEEKPVEKVVAPVEETVVADPTEEDDDFEEIVQEKEEIEIIEPVKVEEPKISDSEFENFKGIDESKYTHGYRVSPQFSEEEFLKEVYRYLYNNDSMPRDIFDAHFGPVETEKREFISADGIADVDYARSVGVDKPEQYEEIQWRKDVHGNRQQERVIKWRTVTDWKQEVGNTIGKSKVFIPLSKKPADNKSIYESYKALSDEQFIPLQKAKLEMHAIDPLGVQDASDAIIENVYQKVAPKNGESVKDPRNSGEVKFSTLDLIILPFYRVDITIRNKKCRLVACAAGKMSCFFEGDGVFPLSSADIEQQDSLIKREKLIRLLCMITLIGGVVLMAGSIPFFVLKIWVAAFILAAVGALSLGAGIYMYLTGKKQIASLDNANRRAFDNVKRNGYEAKLSSMGELELQDKVVVEAQILPSEINGDIDRILPPQIEDLSPGCTVFLISKKKAGRVTLRSGDCGKVVRVMEAGILVSFCTVDGEKIIACSRAELRN